jgi:hypothetical protein
MMGLGEYTLHKVLYFNNLRWVLAHREQKHAIGMDFSGSWGLGANTSRKTVGSLIKSAAVTLPLRSRVPLLIKAARRLD